MSDPILPLAARRWLAEGRPALIVELAAARGSAPREVGARMLVARDAVLGSIGGGHLEYRAIAEARERLARPAARDDAAPAEQRFALGPSLGQCCGGTVTLRYRPLSAPALDAWPAGAPRFHLQLHGAGHVGRAIAALLAGIDCRVSWIDARDAAFDEPGLPAAPHVERLASEMPEAEVAQAPPGACYLVLTHDHALDLRITLAILRRGDFAWFGLIGSASKRARFEHRLRERGVDAAMLARLVCPVGLPGLAGKEPAVIAVSVVAQLLQQAGPPR